MIKFCSFSIFLANTFPLSGSFSMVFLTMNSAFARPLPSWSTFWNLWPRTTTPGSSGSFGFGLSVFLSTIFTVPSSCFTYVTSSPGVNFSTTLYCLSLSRPVHVWLSFVPFVNSTVAVCPFGRFSTGLPVWASISVTVTFSPSFHAPCASENSLFTVNSPLDGLVGYGVLPWCGSLPKWNTTSFRSCLSTLAFSFTVAEYCTSSLNFPPFAFSSNALRPVSVNSNMKPLLSF